jgi:hypothetical protein
VLDGDLILAFFLRQILLCDQPIEFCLGYGNDDSHFSVMPSSGTIRRALCGSMPRTTCLLPAITILQSFSALTGISLDISLTSYRMVFLAPGVKSEIRSP